MRLKDEKIIDLEMREPKKGNIKINSTSKIRKINVTKKNCNEKLIRLFDLGLNPHSNGLIFSESILDFIEILKISNIITLVKVILLKNIIANIIIYIIKLIINLSAIAFNAWHERSESSRIERG